MIPLNKPGKCKSEKIDFFKDYFPNQVSCFLGNAGDCLNLIYRYLFKQYGRLRVGVSPLACFNAIHPIALNGHVPVFLDVDPITFNLSNESLSKHSDLDAVQVIHLGGNPNDMAFVEDWKQRNQAIIVEDCAQAMGATFQGMQLGSFGDFSVFSLIKNTYQSGGLLLSKNDLDTMLCLIDDELSSVALAYKHLRTFLESKCSMDESFYDTVLRKLLRSRDKVGNASGSVRKVSPKYAYRLDASLSSLPAIVQKRLRVADEMIAKIDSRKYMIQGELANACSNRNRLFFRSFDRKAIDVISYLRRNGIGANNLTQHYINEYQEHVSKDSLLSHYYRGPELPVYDGLFPYIFAIPISPFLTQKEVEYIIDVLNSY